MSIILGLDISTSCTGLCIVDVDVEPDSKGSNVILIDKVDFKKCKTIWDKADVVSDAFDKLHYKFEGVYVEEPLMGFQTGMSSAATITTLMKFNGIVSYMARQKFDVDPIHVSAAHARKLCGIKLIQKKKCGISHKDQVFAHMITHDLSHIVWPCKPKSGKTVDWAKDEVDAYVIARAGALMNNGAK